jgi:hypothetical protein
MATTIKPKMAQHDQGNRLHYALLLSKVNTNSDVNISVYYTVLQ